MDGRNADGQRVSLLNDDNGSLDYYRPKFVGHPQLLHLPLLSLRSTVSSSTSTPAISPSTPDLIRSRSTDSVPGQSPSPITPHFYTFPFLLGPRRSGSPYSVSSSSSGTQKHKEACLAYPSLPSHQQSYHSITSGAAAPPPPPLAASVASTSSSSSGVPLSDEQQPQARNQPLAGKKNTYPCPLAKQLGCADLFTTSGHAARHAKKHTGKKDALCPECNKAFTRKDNMEQHRRTHQSRRSSVRPGASARARSRIRHQQEQKKVASAVAVATLSRGASSDKDHPISSAFTQTSLSLNDCTAQEVEDLPMASRGGGSSSLAPGLETLAIAASKYN